MSAVLAAMLFVALSQTIVNTALPRIIAELGGMHYFSWVFSTFLLTSSVPAVLFGKLSDLHGRKPFILAGLLLFMVGSFFSGLAGSIFHLIISRGVQGLGGGMILVTSFSSVGDLFAPVERARWQGLLSAVYGAASLFAPALGGYIVDKANWRWVFWIFLPVGLLAFILLLKLYPQKRDKEQGEEMDYCGTLLLTVFAISLLLACTWAGATYAWSSPLIIALFSISLLTLGSFLFLENRIKNPILPMKLFRNRVFAISIIVGSLLGVGFFGVSMYMPFIVQGVMGASATSSGFVVMPITLCMVIASALSGQAVSRTGKYKKMSLAGLAVMGGGLLSISYMHPESPLMVGALNMMVVGAGLGIVLPIFLSTTQNTVGDEQIGVATATFQMSRQFGGTIGVAILGIVMNNSLIFQLNKIFRTSSAVELWEKEPATAETLASMQNPQILMNPEKLDLIRSLLPPQMEDSFFALLDLLRSALSSSLGVIFIIMAAMLLLAFLLSLFLDEIPLRAGK